MHRRTVLAGLATPFLGACVGTSGGGSDFDLLEEEFRDTGTVEGLSLEQVRRERGIDIGGAIPWPANEQIPPEMWRTIRGEFNIMTPEIHLGWQFEEDFNEISSDVTRLVNAGLKVRGHTLYMWTRIPSELVALADDPNTTAGQVGDWVYAKARERVARWGDRVSYWVINETIDFHGDGGLRPEAVTRKLGMDLFRLLVAAVKDVDPTKPVEMNDFAIERKGAQMDRHITRVADYLDGYDLMFDRVGYQCHVDWDGGTRKDFQAREVLASARRLENLGVDFAITEFDVDDRYFDGTAEARERFVAQHSFDEMRRLAELPRLVEVSTWSPFDVDNWTNRSLDDRAGDNLTQAQVEQSRSGWFDESYNRKLAYYAVCKALT